jgi:coproporphyrinogen III oxidase
MNEPNVLPVRGYLRDLQDRICDALERADGEARFVEDVWEDPEAGASLPRFLSGGPVLERAAVNFTHAKGRELPAAATARRPELAGCPFEAASLSVIVHPRNPYVPTTHMNLRFFLAGGGTGSPRWWFGGGLDLTPYYGFEEDAVHWHRTARDACAPFGPDVHPRFKRWCDEYFFLEHRKEARGIGGLFFDDFAEWDFERTFALARSVGDHFLPGYLPILERRKGISYGEREREFQLLRRGRYVEFNLLYDRGTLYGLQSGRRIEAVLASLPPRVRWAYDRKPEPGSPEAMLYEVFLPPRDWLSGS